MSKQDNLYRYLFEQEHIRGELVQLCDSYQQIIQAQQYPQPVQILLGELLAATSLLTATLKFSGKITLQLQGKGPVHLAVIDGNNNQQLRGVARWKEPLGNEYDFTSLTGEGQLVITITPEQGERYQGIIPLQGETLAQTLEHYFEQSEQLPTRIWLRTGEHDGKAHAAGMLLQALPVEQEQKEQQLLDMDHLSKLTETVKDEELFGLEAEELLYRLYHQEQVRLFDPQAVNFYCPCSEERSAQALSLVDAKELHQLLEEQGLISVNCDYCGEQYKFGAEQVMDIIAKQQGSSDTKQ
ncbi:Hsp33 family molecular chaperone HslO [Dongshaea marina]|uniref:Hsp33 family molecular chaperone HslO n=1 Tax=Dongshaea marina TaxID=2047966 RepID=UPI000D3EDE22|nr:Hsp33 family molecular chaperone HslO [Dongshaea marina]